MARPRFRSQATVPTRNSKGRPREVSWNREFVACFSMKHSSTSAFPFGIARLRLAVIPCCAIFLFTLFGRFDEPARFGPWTTMEARQVSIPIVDGAAAVEVRDLVAGWSERCTVTNGAIDTWNPIGPRTFAAGPEPELEPSEAAFFASEFFDVAPEQTLDGALELAEAVAARAWVVPMAEREGRALAIDGSARRIYEDIRNGDRFNCQSLATVFAAAARARGFRVRRIDLSARQGMPNEGHSIAEVWSEADGTWVAVDPTFGMRLEVDGRPASAFAVHRIVVAGQYERIGVVRRPDAPGLDPWTYAVNPLLFFRHVYLRVDGGPWLTFAGPHEPPGPAGQTGVLQVRDSAPFVAGLERVDVAERRSGIGHEIVAQVLGGELHVDVAGGDFTPGRFEFRTTDGRSCRFTPSIERLDVDGAGFGAGEELVGNPGLECTDGDLPSGWELTGGAATCSREAAGGVTIETGETACELRAPLLPTGGGGLAASCRIRVHRGFARFGLWRRTSDHDVLVEPVGWTTVSPVMLAPEGRRPRAIVWIAPHSRVTVEGVHVRQLATMAEVLRADAPGHPNELRSTTLE